MEDDVDAAHELAHELAVADVALDDAYGAVGLRPRRGCRGGRGRSCRGSTISPAPGCDQLVGDVRADRPGTAGDEDALACDHVQFISRFDLLRQRRRSVDLPMLAWTAGSDCCRAAGPRVRSPPRGPGSGRRPPRASASSSLPNAEERWVLTVLLGDEQRVGDLAVRVAAHDAGRGSASRDSDSARGASCRASDGRHDELPGDDRAQRRHQRLGELVRRGRCPRRRRAATRRRCVPRDGGVATIGDPAITSSVPHARRIRPRRRRRRRRDRGSRRRAPQRSASPRSGRSRAAGPRRLATTTASAGRSEQGGSSWPT